ncbi:6-carboxytetrahydropterin synthase [Shouchella miscanthi]|uniref:6-carboxy-5,6,7,8-tetrahydropterin synthase n=1 Tax=Shouchella miscanthi TaxID=2598861 RepID=A0ABU6NEX0_9BACI|nr:6-carboxytetrahydropterin synthase [Shouchella miscanthi]
MKKKYSIIKDFWISSAHSVAGAGKCERIHGHNYKIKFCLEGERLNDKGMLLDFRVIKHEIEKRYDHRLLNDFEEFDTRKDGKSPTTEYFSEVVFNIIRDICKEEINEPRVKWVEIQETNEAIAKFELIME